MSILLITAIIGRPFNTKTCEVIQIAARLDDPSEREERMEVKNEFEDWIKKFKDQGEEGKKLREKYEYLIFLKKNKVEKTYRFTDPAVIERQKAIQTYREARAAADRAEAELQSATEVFLRVDAAKDARAAAAESLEHAHAALAAIAPEVLTSREFNAAPEEETEAEPVIDPGVFPSPAKTVREPEPVEIVLPPFQPTAGF